VTAVQTVGQKAGEAVDNSLSRLEGCVVVHSRVDLPAKHFSTRWHPVAVLAALFVALAFAFANIPGTPIIGPDILGNGKYGPHFECDVVCVEHGWPTAFLTHDGHFSGSFYSAWRIGPNATVHFRHLAVNLSLALAGIGLGGWLVNRRLR
jgi:hypothetical protein